MTDSTKILRRLDEEIVYCNQQIAALQVRIANAQNTRRFIMGLEEDDQAAEAMRREGNAALNGTSYARPMLIVRKAGSGDEPKEKKTRKGRAGTVSASGEMRERIIKLLASPDTPPMTPAEIGNHLGLPRGESNRKVMNNALYQLRIAGKVTRNGSGKTGTYAAVTAK